MDGYPDYDAIYKDYSAVESVIDDIPYGPKVWSTYAVRYNGPVDANSASWKRETYFIHARNTLHVAEALAGSTDFKEKFDIMPFEEYTGPGCRRISHLMSGRWAYKQAVRHLPSLVHDQTDASR